MLCATSVLLSIGKPSVARPASELFASCETVLSELQPVGEEQLIFPKSGNPCWFYMSGIQDSLRLLEVSGDRLKQVCMPADLTVPQLIRSFVVYARPISRDLHLEAIVVVLQAFRNVYPCKLR